MADVITFRAAVTRAIAQEMRRDDSVVLLGEDVAAAGGVFKTTKGLLDEFGPTRVRDTPISEEAIIGAAMGAAMTGMRPIAEIMFSDFLATCWDMVAVQIAKARYMTNGQVTLPLVIRTANGGGLRFGAQHSQAVENWAMMVPGLKVVAPSNAHDLIGLFAASVRSDDPVVFLEQKSLYPEKYEVSSGEIIEELGRARTVRSGTDVTLVALAYTVRPAVQAAELLAQEHGVSAEVIDLRSLVPLDVSTVLESVARTSRLVTIEENPRLSGWGAEVVSLVGEECFWNLEGPLTRVTTPHIPLPSADALEDAVLPSADDVVTAVLKALA